MTSLEFSSKLIGLERSLLQYAYSLSLKRADAKDLLQETYLRVLINQHKYVDSQKFKSWAMTIMRNTFIDNYRRNSRSNSYPIASNDSLAFNKTEPFTNENPESTLSEKEISLTIDKLHDKLKTPFKMYISGYKYSEIAENLNLNLGTVKNRIFLSRKQLMTELNA